MPWAPLRLSPSTPRVASFPSVPTGGRFSVITTTASCASLHRTPSPLSTPPLEWTSTHLCGFLVPDSPCLCELFWPMPSLACLHRLHSPSVPTPLYRPGWTSLTGSASIFLASLLLLVLPVSWPPPSFFSWTGRYITTTSGSTLMAPTLRRPPLLLQPSITLPPPPARRGGSHPPLMS